MILLGERSKKVLKIIVEEYIETAKPVSSLSICELLDCSSATVRNVMAELENIGYIEKTHTSSGRIPSELGYRYYVDNLMIRGSTHNEDIRMLESIFSNSNIQLSDAINKSLEIISELTNYTSVVLGSSANENLLKKVEIMPLSDNNIIALIITDKGHVEHKNLTIPDTISIEEMKRVTEIINKLLINTPIDRVSEKLEYDVKPIIGKYVKQHEVIYETFLNVFNEVAQKSSMHFVGKNNILKQPEFNSLERVRDIIDKFDDRSLVDHIKANKDGINVYIGSENEFDEDVTIIKSKYNINGEIGTIAIVGPKRMEYDRIIGLLEYLNSNINR